MSTPQTTTPAPEARTPWGKAIGIGIAASLAVLILVLAFLWPSKTSSPHNIPLTLAGPEAATAQVKEQLEQAGDTFTVTTVLDRDAAVQAVKERESYGAVVLNPTGAPEVLTAPAAGPVPTQLVTGVATQLQAQLSAQTEAAGAEAPQVSVTAVVPLSADDPTGTGLTAAGFPLAMGGMIAGVMAALLIRGTWQRLATAVTVSAAGSGLLVWVMQGWFGYLQGNAWMNFLAVGLTILATATFMIGCVKLLGRPGMALGPIVTMLIANPISGAQLPPEFLPGAWGGIGQFFVPGAGNTLLRSLSYFPDAATAGQWLILLGWVALGVILALVGHASVGRRAARSRPTTETVDAEIVEA